MNSYKTTKSEKAAHLARCYDLLDAIEHDKHLPTITADLKAIKWRLIHAVPMPRNGAYSLTQWFVKNAVSHIDMVLDKKMKFSEISTALFEIVGLCSSYFGGKEKGLLITRAEINSPRISKEERSKHILKCMELVSHAQRISDSDQINTELRAIQALLSASFPIGDKMETYLIDKYLAENAQFYIELVLSHGVKFNTISWAIRQCIESCHNRYSTNSKRAAKPKSTGTDSK